MAPACTRVHVVAGAPQSGWCQCLCPQGKALQDQQLGLTQAPFKLFLLPWVPEHVRFCMFPLRVEFLFHTALWDSPSKPHCPSKPNVLGAYLPGTGPTGWQA